MAARRTRRILLLGMESHYGHGVTLGVNEYFRKHGECEYWLERYGVEGEDAVERWKADGIIAFTLDEKKVLFVRRARVPVVNVTENWEVEAPTVVGDNVAVGRMAAEHFLANGFRNFAFGGVTPEVGVRKRCEGFVEAVEKAGFSCEVFTDRFSGYVDAFRIDNRRRMNGWLTGLKKPVGLMGSHDPRAVEILWACRHLGLQVPEEVAVVGAGNEELHCGMSTPALSSVEFDMRGIGYEAGAMLHRLIEGRASAKGRVVRVAPRGVITRQSSDTVAIEDADIAEAVRFIRDHGREAISVKDVLAAVPICRRTLERRFVALIGRTPRKELSRVRLAQARRMLEETDLAMPAVSRGSGFVRRVNFSEFFRRETGMTPTEYRRKFRMRRGVQAGRR